MFGEKPLVADGATMGARGLDAETASATSRMNTPSNMYSKADGEFGGSKVQGVDDSSLVHGRFTVLADGLSKSEARLLLKDGSLELPESQRLKVLKQLSGGRMDKVTLKLMKDGELRLSATRAGGDNGFQRMSFGIDVDGNTNKVVQTAFDGSGNLVRQNPGALKNNLYDVKEWKVLTY